MTARRAKKSAGSMPEPTYSKDELKHAFAYGYHQALHDQMEDLIDAIDDLLAKHDAGVKAYHLRCNG